MHVCAMFDIEIMGQPLTAQNIFIANELCGLYQSKFQFYDVFFDVCYISAISYVTFAYMARYTILWH